jgi:biopolymer transport protein ExbB/TolQ
MIVILMLCSPITIFYRIHSAVALYRVSKKHKVIENQHSEATGNQHSESTENPQSDAAPEERLGRTLQNFAQENESLLQQQDSLRGRWSEFLQTISEDDRQRYSSQFEELSRQLRGNTT